MALNLELKNLETRTLWILSTAHITQAERDGDFGENASPIVQGKNDYSINVYANPDRALIEEADYSPHLKAILLEANRLGIVEIRFDCDGELIEGLPEFI